MNELSSVEVGHPEKYSGVLTESQVKDEIRGGGWNYAIEPGKDGQEIHTLWRRIKPEVRERFDVEWAANDRREVGFRKESETQLSVAIRLSGVIEEDIRITETLNRQIEAIRRQI